MNEDLLPWSFDLWMVLKIYVRENNTLLTIIKEVP